MTSTITVRLSEKERRELQRYGKISEVVREALRLYLRNRASRGIISRLKELQKITTMRTAIQDDLQLIRTDRER
jgi:Arc/MetJ-type ribon-helix-helix transcriptional regulator